MPALATAGAGCLGGEDRSAGVGEGGVPVAHQEPELLDAVRQVHEEGTGLLGDRFPGWLAVTPRIWTRRVETSSTNRTSRRLRKTVSSGRGRRPRSLGLGGQELLPGQAGVAWCRVDAASVEEQPHRARCELCPSRASSPWRRRELHVGFSAAIGRIRRRSSGTVEGRPGWWCGEVQRRLIRSRCQPSTISGVTNRWRRCCVGSRRVNAARRPGLARRSVVG